MITLSDFEYYAPSVILARGENYYKTSAVKELEETSPDEWEAIVAGTEIYTVNR